MRVVFFRMPDACIDSPPAVLECRMALARPTAKVKVPKLQARSRAREVICPKGALCHGEGDMGMPHLAALIWLPKPGWQGRPARGRHLRGRDGGA